MTLTKPINRVLIIQEKDATVFIQKFNENIVDKEFLNSCKKASKLFNEKRQKQ